jgi:peptide/nickel transport system permease protein
MSVAEIEARETGFEAAGGLWSDAWGRLRRNPGAIVGFVLVGIFVVVAIFAPLIAPYDPREQGPLSEAFDGLSRDHWLGLDALSRDEFSRIVYGARVSLLIGVVSVTVGLSIVAMLGPGLFEIMIAVGVTQIPIFARLVRGSVLAQLENDFVLAARAVGVPKRQILGAHILPNAISPVIVQGTLALATAIIDVAGLGFLGLGPQDPSTPEWGTMLADVNRYFQTGPHLAIVPGVAIVLSVLGFNLIGDGLREALDPKLRGRA